MLAIHAGSKEHRALVMDELVEMYAARSKVVPQMARELLRIN